MGWVKRKGQARALGGGRHLLGVMTTPVAERKPLAILLFNAGVVHRIGPHRMNVKLARHLAGQGYTTVRFDLSGLGDSRVPLHAAPFRDQAVRDIREVIDYLAREEGLQQVALCGICSGAENAYATALADPRVVGVFLFDGYAYPTMKSRMIRQIARVRSITMGKLKRRALTLVSAFRKKHSTRERAAGPLLPPPTQAEFAAGMQALIDRGVRVALAFSGSGEYRYTGQMRDCFGGHRFLDEIACHYTPDIDHLVTPLVAQQRFVALVDEWLATISSRQA
jgi:pimeloyl-ACP methyl ester carboxylesterase